MTSSTVSEAETDQLQQQPSSNRRLALIVAVVGFGAAVAAYFWMIHHYASNVVYLDQWSDVNLAARSYDHTLSIGNLWTQHAEQRMLVPNAVMLVLVHLTHFNIIVEEYLSALLLCVAAALVIWTHKERTPSRGWWAYCPVAIVALSLVQAESSLFGFQLAWYCAIVMLALTLFLLDRPTLSPSLLGAAIVAATIGSFCTIQGLIIWPVGLLLCYQRARTRRSLVVWSVAAVVVIVVYAYRFNTNEAVPSNLNGLHLPLQAARSYFWVIGDVLGVPLKSAGGTRSNAVLLFGVLIFAIAVYAVVRRGLQRDVSSGAPVGVALICFGLIYAAGFAYSRAFAGPVTASSGQYATFTLWLLIGCYLTLMDTPLRPAHTGSWFSRAAPLVALLLLAVVCLQVVFGEVNGVRSARSDHQRRVQVAGAIADIGQVPNPVLQAVVAGYGIKPATLRSYAAVLKAHHLTFFDDPAQLAAYEEEGRVEEQAGVFDYHPTRPVAVVRPTSGATVRQTVLLDALVQSSLEAQRVEFSVTDDAHTVVAVGHGKKTAYGWILHWDTRNVPDGPATVSAVAYGAGNKTTQSAAVPITVANG